MAAMSRITEELRKYIEGLDLGKYYQDPICMYPVSKDFKGRFEVREQKPHQCSRPDCLTLSAFLTMESEVVAHRPCDSVACMWLDGKLTAELVFKYIQDGEHRGYHVAKAKWGAAGGTLIGKMAGITNAGTHREPLMNCERCDERGHMEGRLDAVVVDGEYKGSRLLASYAIRFDPGLQAQNTAIIGTLEGVLIRPCEG
jgi:hypothetical protein